MRCKHIFHLALCKWLLSNFNIPFLSSGELRLTQLTRATPLKLVLKCGFSRRGAINTIDASNATEIETTRMCPFSRDVKLTWRTRVTLLKVVASVPSPRRCNNTTDASNAIEICNKCAFSRRGAINTTDESNATEIFSKCLFSRELLSTRLTRATRLKFITSLSIPSQPGRCD